MRQAKGVRDTSYLHLKMTKMVPVTG